jgi:hypothetical protein
MPIENLSTSRRSFLLLLFAAALAAACYAPGLWGPFVFDDEPNITRNSVIQLNSLTPEKLVLAAWILGEALAVAKEARGTSS